METADGKSAEHQLLDKLIAERAEIDQLIGFLQRRLGLSDGVLTNTAIAVHNATVQKGEFFGMSRPEAAIALLRKARRTLSTNEIFQTLQDSGMDMSGKNALSALYTSLVRHLQVKRVARNTWGLTEWYPNMKDTAKDKKKAETNEPKVDASSIDASSVEDSREEDEPGDFEETRRVIIDDDIPF